MSRNYGNHGKASEKRCKKAWHTRFRSKNRRVLMALLKGDERPIIVEREISDPWLMSKDRNSGGRN